MGNVKIKKIVLDRSFKPVLQFNNDGTIVMYTSDEEAYRYELTYHYFYGKLISISQKDRLVKKNMKIYTIFEIFFAKLESMLFVDKSYYVKNRRNEKILVQLFNNMLVY